MVRVEVPEIDRSVSVPDPLQLVCFFTGLRSLANATVKKSFIKYTNYYAEDQVNWQQSKVGLKKSRRSMPARPVMMTPAPEKGRQMS